MNEYAVKIYNTVPQIIDQDFFFSLPAEYHAAAQGIGENGKPWVSVLG